jgi:hypothetical protein
LEAITDTKIKEQLITLLHDRYNIPLRSLNSKQWDIPLTSKEIGLNGFLLAHLLFEVEEIYGKSFGASLLKDYGFCTINNIVKAILSTYSNRSM